MSDEPDDIEERNVLMGRAVTVFHRLGTDPTWIANPAHITFDAPDVDYGVKFALIAAETTHPPVAIVALSARAIEQLEAVTEGLR
jgi:hypothetical protein